TTAGCRDLVVFSLTGRFAHGPVFLQQSPSLDSLERRIQRTFLHGERVFGRLANPTTNRVTMHTALAHRFENQHIECSNEQITSAHRFVLLAGLVNWRELSRLDRSKEANVRGRWKR